VGGWGSGDHGGPVVPRSLRANRVSASSRGVDGEHGTTDQEHDPAAGPRARPRAGSATRAGFAAARAGTDPRSTSPVGAPPIDLERRTGAFFRRRELP